MCQKWEIWDSTRGIPINQTRWMTPASIGIEAATHVGKPVKFSIFWGWTSKTSSYLGWTAGTKIWTHILGQHGVMCPLPSKSHDPYFLVYHHVSQHWRKVGLSVSEHPLAISFFSSLWPIFGTCRQAAQVEMACSHFWRMLLEEFGSCARPPIQEQKKLCRPQTKPREHDSWAIWVEPRALIDAGWYWCNMEVLCHNPAIFGYITLHKPHIYLLDTGFPVTVTFSYIPRNHQSFTSSLAASSQIPTSGVRISRPSSPPAAEWWPTVPCQWKSMEEQWFPHLSTPKHGYCSWWQLMLMIC
jgi:hypothetical protein